MTMNPFEQSKQQLLHSLTSQVEQEVIDYIRQEMQHDAPDSVPAEDELLTFFQSPDEATTLNAYQQMLVTDKLLEYAEISLRTVCDLIRYQQLKELGVVHSKTISPCRTKSFRSDWTQARSQCMPIFAVLKTDAPISAGRATLRSATQLAAQRTRSCDTLMRSQRKVSSPQSQPLS